MSTPAPLTRKVIRFVDQRTGSVPVLRKLMRYLFPDHWSFLLGEVALYAFMVLVATGIYLTFFFVDSVKEITYHGPYLPLQGQHVSEAYQSVVNISLTVKAGLLIRQTHHWAADIFIAAIVLHLLRIFFTGAFRKPRDLTYLIGVTMLVLALLEAYVGYSMVDDLLSGMGLVIGYSVGMSIPFFGANLMALTPISPFRPRRWRGALIPGDLTILLRVLDPVKRPVSAVADQHEVRDVAKVEVRVDRSLELTLLFDPEHALDERITMEQFTA